MALKDLVVDTGKVAEEAIENIISDTIRYELDPPAIVSTPEGRGLSNDAKVLTYLVAMLGWRYVADDPPTIGTRPVDLEDALGIPGGSLRPALKKLKDNHLITEVDGHYQVRPSNLEAVRRAISGEGRFPPSKRSPRTSKTPRASKPQLKGDQGLASDDVTAAKSNGAGAKRKSGAPIMSSLKALIANGFFNEFRTLGQIVERLHELAIIAKSTSLSGPVADLVRNGILMRKKIEAGGKMVWAYKVA